MKVYALLIGINIYKNSSINRLEGCINDVNSIKQFLKTRFNNLSIKTLINEEATKQEIINSFLNHPKEAKEGDVILVYYSGHGSTEIKNPFGEQQNETIVCHDSRTNGVFDLADKEIAYLISKIPVNTKIVLCFDSCHSGNITREEVNLKNKKFTSKHSIERELNSYYGYKDVHKLDIKVPNRPHIVFSACDKNEVAWETHENQGLFTKSLLEILNNNQQLPSYYELYRKIQIKIRQSHHFQTPQLHISGENNDIHDSFLTGEPVFYENHVYNLYFDGSQKLWMLNAGALHGVTMYDNEQIKIYSLEEKKYIGEASLIEIGITTSVVEVTEKLLDIQSTYSCIPKIGKLNIAIWTDLPGFDNIDISYVKVNDKKDADFWIRENERSFQIISAQTEKIITQTREIGRIKHFLSQIAYWEYIYSLQNAKTQLNQDDFIVEWKAKEGNPLQEKTYILSHKDSLSYFFSNYDDNIPYQVTLKNNSKSKIYATLLCMTPYYGIYCLGQSDGINPNEAGILYDYQGGLIFLNRQIEENINTSNILFKLIISTIPFEVFDIRFDYIELNKVEHRGARMSDKVDVKKIDKEDWLCKDIFVNLFLHKQHIEYKKDENTFLKLNDEIELITSNVSLDIILEKQLQKGLKQKNIQDQISFIDSNCEVISLNGANIIHLNNIETLNDEKLTLEFKINHDLQDNEYLVSVAIDGDRLIPIGYSNIENKNQIEIDYFPNISHSQRNIGRALKLCLLKVVGDVLGKESKGLFQLSMLNYENDEPEYITDTEVIKAIIQSKEESQKILLLIHGIIGNTKDMTTFASQLKEKYDIILAFDYENLNSSIEGIASKLKEQLQKIGINATKTITILAHSMGGLVSRFLIEKDGGNKYVEKLVMCGTPNGGSLFGRIDTYRKFLSIAGGLMAFLINPITSIKWIAGMLGAINLIKHTAGSSAILTTTLGQMNKESEFLRQLNEGGNDSEIPYFILAGDIHKYQNQEFFDKIYRTIGDWVNNDKPNDIAVLSDDIKKYGQNSKVEIHDIACHHLNYFTEANSIFKLLEIL